MAATTRTPRAPRVPTPIVEVPASRVPALPTEAQIVFGGCADKRRAIALYEQRVDSLMASFDLVRTRPVGYHRDIVPIFDYWPVRRYLDSGIFTLMRKVGTSHIKKVGAKSTIVGTVEDEIKKLAKEYIAYLSQYGSTWDHVAELDCDDIPGLGPALTLKLRAILRQAAGDKLMPVWHPQAGVEGWHNIIGDFPYVAMGSGIYGVGHDSALGNFHYLRSLIRDAHHAGTLVHLMGTTREEAMHETEADSGDSVTWISAMKFGQFGNIRYTEKQSKAWRIEYMSMARSFEDYCRRYGADPANLLAPGANLDKLKIAIRILQERELRIRLRRRQNGGVQTPTHHN